MHPSVHRPAGPPSGGTAPSAVSDLTVTPAAWRSPRRLSLVLSPFPYVLFLCSSLHSLVLSAHRGPPLSCTFQSPQAQSSPSTAPGASSTRFSPHPKVPSSFGYCIFPSYLGQLWFLSSCLSQEFFFFKKKIACKISYFKDF